MPWMPAPGVPPSGGVERGAPEEVLALRPETAETRRLLLGAFFGKSLGEGASGGECVRRVDCNARQAAQGWLRSARPELGQAQILDVHDPTPPDHEPSTLNERLTEIEDGRSTLFGDRRRGRHPTFHVQPL